MKEGQTLRDILVPVVVGSEAMKEGVDDLSVVLPRLLTRLGDTAPRVVIMGGPGSGKSVALRVIARDAWSLVDARQQLPLIPVLLTFADYRRAQFNLTEALVESMCRHGFLSRAGLDRREAARKFMQESLGTGRVLILLDALDELDFGDRSEAARRLNSDLRAYPLAPAIITCREAAWRGQFSFPGQIVVRMADFTPAAIRQFVHNWSFQLPKSARELLAVIQEQPHVGQLARNPLMLTIIAFLYSQPKYRLPENRGDCPGFR
jgi:predicted NACHT family NTPase